MSYLKPSLVVILMYFTLLVNESSCSDLQHDYVSRGSRNYEKMERSTFHISLWVLVFLILLTTLCFLILLGIIKGALGLFLCAPVGMWGLGSLIDLPRPLERYQERDLADVPVQYDPTGWPVHPETGKRSVRAITKTTEFYLNVIFFLTYPLAIVLTLCSACCFKDDADSADQQYKCVNTIVFAEYDEKNKKKGDKSVTSSRKEKSKKTAKKKNEDIYADEDSAEDIDTRYVVYQMQCSQQSLGPETTK